MRYSRFGDFEDVTIGESRLKQTLEPRGNSERPSLFLGTLQWRKLQNAFPSEQTTLTTIHAGQNWCVSLVSRFNFDGLNLTIYSSAFVGLQYRVHVTLSIFNIRIQKR